jgi:pyruvate,water dikinase
MDIRWFDDVRADETATAGGKGASLGELTSAGLPVPGGFVVTVGAYRTFLEESGIGGELFETIDVDPGDTSAVAGAAERARDLIEGTPVPETVRASILEAYDAFGDDPFVAVRSSATAEDLPDASFAGQQETFLNVTREDLVDRVRECWGSLFTERAMAYRARQGFDGTEVGMAVVVQRMIDADRSGVLFTHDPSTGETETVIEAAWGLGEGVVSGTVSPDTYVVDRDGSVTSVTVADKKRAVRRDPETGETVEREVGETRRTARVLSDAELAELADLGARVEDHYGEPQDIEWAMDGEEVVLLQSRPITTIEDGSGETNEDAENSRDGDASEGDATQGGTGEGEPIVSGLGASPGVAAGPARIVGQLDELDAVREGDILVTPMTTPDMVPAMKRAAALVTDEGGLTSHAAIVSRELGVPAVTGTGDATDVLSREQPIEVDGERGTVTEAGRDAGTDASEDAEPPAGTVPATGGEPAGGPDKPMTATEVKVNVSLPAAAERAAATGADGVGLLRLEHMVLEMGKTPAAYIADHGADAYVDELVGGIRTVADAFYPRPVRVRTLDAPTDEFRSMEGGDDEPVEPNPMLGFRGIRRSLAEPDVFEHELSAFRELRAMGYDNVELMFPLVNDAGDVAALLEAMDRASLDPDRQSWGVMVETPAAALSIEELADAGIDFASFGTNDLTQYTLAVDRNNERVADRYEATHPAVRSLMSDVIEVCRTEGVRTSICGEAASDPEMVRFLVKEGITSVSVNIDAVADAQREAKRVEQRLLLDSVR